MKLTFIGTGSAFTVGEDNFHSNMILESDSGKKLLIDCGTDARFALHELGLSAQDIHDVYISHLHADHFGGLEWLAFSTKYHSNAHKPGLFIKDQLSEELWNHALSAPLNPSNDPSVKLSDYFDLKKILNETFHWEGITFHLFPTLHVTHGQWKMPSFGLWFEMHQKKILITTDTLLTGQMVEFYSQCDLIFHDCETSQQKTGIHAHYTELKLLNSSIKNKMWLYHYQPGPLPDALKDGFRGFVKKGQFFDLNNEETYKLNHSTLKHNNTQSAIVDSLLQKFKKLISETTGLAITDEKEIKLTSSILWRVQELQLSDPLHYYQKLIIRNNESDHELIKLVCSFINKESHFFRDKGQLDALKNEIFPQLIKQKNEQKELRIWSAGCAQGEEPYSIAMILYSLIPNWSNWKITIIGTDLCPDVIEKARIGLYGNMAFRSMSVEDKKRFFSKQPTGDYLIQDFLKEAVIFKQSNLLMDDFPNAYSHLHQMDLILCRNVFIYFQKNAVAKVVEKFNRTLNQGGYLLTGHGDILDMPTASFKREILQGTIVYRKNGNLHDSHILSHI